MLGLDGAGEGSAEALPAPPVNRRVSSAVEDELAEALKDTDREELQQPQHPPGAMGEVEQEDRLIEAVGRVEQARELCLRDEGEERDDKEHDDKDDLEVGELVGARVTPAVGNAIIAGDIHAAGDGGGAVVERRVMELHRVPCFLRHGHGGLDRKEEAETDKAVSWSWRDVVGMLGCKPLISSQRRDLPSQ